MSEEGFKFDLGAKRTLIANAQIIDALRTFAKSLGGRSFYTYEFSAWSERPCRAETVTRRFGTWREALARAGIAKARGRLYGSEELIENLEQVWRALGRPPGMKLLTRHGRCTYRPYIRMWGSVRRACEMLAEYHAGRISREALLAGDPAPPPKRRTLPRSVRWTVLERDGFRCVACGASPKVDRSVKLEIDHIHPASREGGDNPANLRTLCLACNRGKGDRVSAAA